MKIVLVGLNHRTASVELREQLTLASCALRDVLDDLGRYRQASDGGHGHLPRQPHLPESLILSTCNRLEVYAVVTGSSADGWAAIEQFLANLQGIPQATLHSHLYFLDGYQAVHHLMRVACGLDSMILGEPQILGQVRGALEEARAAGTSGPILSHLFDLAAHAGKRARTETEIGRHTTSIGHAAVQLLADELDDLAAARILVVGAGEMAEVAAHALQDRGVQHLDFINRTFTRAHDLAQQFNGRALNWYYLPMALAEADAVIAATGAPHIVVHTAEVEQALLERGGRPLTLLDIAVPRDIEQEAGHLPGVCLYDIDHLQSTVDANLAQRQSAVPDVEAIVDEETERFEIWLHGRQVLPVLVELRRKARDIADEELERHVYRMEDLEPLCQEKVAQVVYRIVNKLLHEPTVRLKASAAEGNGVEYAYALRELFALEAAPIAPQPSQNGKANGRGEQNHRSLAGDPGEPPPA